MSDKWNGPCEAPRRTPEPQPSLEERVEELEKLVEELTDILFIMNDTQKTMARTVGNLFGIVKRL